MSKLQFLYQPFAKLAASSFINNPIFIVGSGRSGTSVLLQSLGQHRNILALPGEAPFLTTIGGAASLFTGPQAAYYQSSAKVEDAYLYKHLAQLGLETAGGRNFAFKNLLKKLTSKKIFRPLLVKHWAAKTFPPEQVADGLVHVYPNCRYLYIIRNGIEVVNSKTKFHGFKENTFKNNCQSWSNSVNTYNFLKSRKNSLFIRHEDLVNSPAQQFERIFNFLGLTHDKDCIDYIENTLVHPLDQAGIKSKNISAKLKNRRNPYLDWSRQQQDIFLTECEGAMKDTGYCIPDSTDFQNLKKPVN